jgi:hypothetical protein
MSERTHIGLDVHGRSVVAGVLKAAPARCAPAPPRCAAPSFAWLREQGEALSMASARQAPKTQRKAMVPNT